MILIKYIKNVNFIQVLQTIFIINSNTKLPHNFHKY